MQESFLSTAGFASWLAPGCALLAVCGLVAALVTGRRSSLWRRRSLFLAALGPLVWGLWRGYLSLVQFRPQDGSHGLTQIRILLACLASGVILALALGAVARRFLGGERPGPPA